MKYRCKVCGQIVEVADGEPCPICGASHDKLVPIEETPKAGELKWACEHEIGVAQGVDEFVLQGCRDHFKGECSEVGMYLAMARQALREGYPEIAEAFKRYAFEEAEHAAKFAELLGEVLTNSTEKNLKMRIDAEVGACAGKKELATLAKQLNYDAVHDTVHEMCKDEARHGCGFKGLYDRYFK